ncbi:hypothetical protein BC830DRAFT_1109676 [Chytriomyces sp. MP71]|nr:hypothetical protein BC830DRAFT_1109676 [Chytriomyces sp. MP71]
MPDGSARPTRAVPPTRGEDELGFGFGVETLVRDRVKTFAAGAPLTSVHLGVSALLHSLALVGIAPLRAQSFHPRLALAPAFQLHRIPLSVFVLGRSLPQVAYSVVSLVTWHSQLEILTCGTGDVYKNNRIVKRGSNRRNKENPKERKSVLSWLLTQNKFIRIQLATLAATVALEMILYADPKDPANAIGITSSSVLSRNLDRAVLVFPYALFPVYDAALRWIWAFTELEKDTLIFGVVPVRPIYMPFVSMLMGYGKFMDVVKGFAIGTAVAAALKLRRGGVDLEDFGSEDGQGVSGGELVGEFLWQFGQGWFRWFRAASRKLLNIQHQVQQQQTPGAFPSMSSSAGSVPQFNVADANAFLDATAIPALGPLVAEARDVMMRVANGVIEMGNENRGSAGASSSTTSGAARRRSRRTEEMEVQMEEVETMRYRWGGN